MGRDHSASTAVTRITDPTFGMCETQNPMINHGVLCFQSRRRYPFVGASLLAKNPRTPRGTCQPALSLTTIASELAPTRLCICSAGADTPCRSELAREKPENTAGHLPTSVIVDDHRERARSYRVVYLQRRRRYPFVGASLLAINPRTPRGTCQPALSLTTIASELAPTRFFVFSVRFMPEPRSGSSDRKHSGKPWRPRPPRSRSACTAPWSRRRQRTHPVPTFHRERRR